MRHLLVRALYCGRSDCRPRLLDMRRTVCDGTVAGCQPSVQSAAPLAATQRDTYMLFTECRNTVRCLFRVESIFRGGTGTGQ